MKTKLIPCLALAFLALASCEKKETEAKVTEATPAPSLETYFTDEAIAGGLPISEAGTTAKPGDEIVIHGLVMGREKVFVDGRASFLLGDRTKLTPCNAVPGDECATPWDACCDSKETKRGNIASIQILGEDGRVLSGEIRGIHGLKELSDVTVTGTVADQSTADSLIINATRIHVGKQ